MTIHFGPLATRAETEASVPSEPQVSQVAFRSPAHLDISSLAALFSEMQGHYQRPVTDEQAVEAAILACQPVRTMFDPRVVIAALDTIVVGSIILNVTFPAFELTRALYIRDLFVSTIYATARCWTSASKSCSAFST